MDRHVARVDGDAELLSEWARRRAALDRMRVPSWR
jgi:hypothetical protein